MLMNYQISKTISAFIFLIIFVFACSKTEQPTPIGELDKADGISEDAIEKYAGEIGLLIDVRDLAKKGYQPTRVKMTSGAMEKNINQSLEIDLFTHLARLSLPLDQLSKEAETELRDGVSITIDIQESNGNSILKENFEKISLKENGFLIVPDAAGIDNRFTEFEFQENAPHFLQIYFSTHPHIIDNVAFISRRDGDRNARVWREYEGSDFAKHQTNAQFYFQKWPNEEKVYAIYAAHTKRYLAIDDNDGTLRQSGAYSFREDISNLHPRYLFRIAREEAGTYSLSSMSGKPLKQTEQSFTTNSSGRVALFKIVSLDIEWAVEDLGVKQLPPIYPAAETSFGFNSTLINCGSGALQQEVGIERTETTSFTSSYEESIGLSSRVTNTIGTSVTAEAEANFFGSKASVSGTISAELEVSVEATKTSTRGVERTTEKTDTYFSKRLVSVPSGKASLVYDAYQTYSNVRVPFVQRFRITGKYSDTGEAVSGKEIASQYSFATGRGVITEIGSTYIEITVRGTTVLDNILKTKSEVRDVASGC